MNGYFDAGQTPMGKGRSLLSEKISQADSRSLRPVEVRFAIIVFLLLMAIVALPLLGLESALPFVLVLLSLAIFTNLLSYAWIVYGKAAEYRVYFAIIIDFFLITITLHYLGGIETPLAWVYSVVLIAFALLHGIKVGIFAAAIGSLMFSSLLVGEFTGMIPHVSYDIVNSRYIHEDAFYLSIKLVCDNILFFITAAVAGLLSERLIRNRNELENRNKQLLEMQEALKDYMSNLETVAAARTEEIFRVNETLQESEERYRKLVDNSLTAIALLQDWKIQFVNKTLIDMSGYQLEELLQKTATDLIHPDDREFVLEAATRRLSGEDLTGHYTYRAITNSGDILWLEGFGTVVEHKGRPALLLNLIDITERKRAEDALRKSEEKYRTLLDSISAGFFETDLAGNIIFFNDTVRRFLGYSEGELRGLNFEELVAEKDAKTIYRAFNKVYRTGQADRGFNSNLILKDGTVKPIEFSVSLVLDDRGKPVGFRGVARDITEKKRLEQQLLQAQKLESIGTLAGGIAHDFNNLLAGILGYASLVKTKISNDHEVFKYVDTVERSATRAAELTAQLLAFARGGKYEAKAVNLNSIVNETLDIISRTFEKSIEIKTSLYSPLPTIEADAGQIQQVLLNLCVNARDAMPDGGRLIIETNVASLAEDYAKAHMGARPGKYVCLSVSDTGIGMDKKTAQRVFEPFFTTKPEGKGTGLGLAMVYGVVKNHGGYTSVYSEPEQGSTFRIYLPVKGKPEMKEPPGYEAPKDGNELILVVDDEESVRSLVKDLLETYGYRVIVAENGVEALEMYKEQGDLIDLVMLDMVMPRMGGHETFSKLKEYDPKVKALLSTGYSQNGKAREILDKGVMGFIQKPYRVEELLSKVRHVLDTEI